MAITELEALTAAADEAWALSHSRRVLRLAVDIGEGLDYDHDVLLAAAYLHDWGAFAKFRQPGVDHALRSRQVIESEVLPRLRFTPERATFLLDAIELHDYRDIRPVPTTEALLLREADSLDFLGVLGVARECAWGPNNIATCIGRVRRRLDDLRNRFTLPRAQETARQRIARMEQCLSWLDEEAQGQL